MITHKMVKVNKDDEDFALVAYAVYGILSFMFSTMIALLISTIGYFPYIVLLIIALSLLDSMSGVYHAKTHRACLIYTQCMYLFGGLNIMFMHEYYLLFLIFSLLAAFFNLNPHYMENAPQHKPEKQKIFKRKYIVRLAVFCITNIILSLVIYFKPIDINFIILQKLSILISVTILINKFSITKLSKIILDKLK